MIFECWFCILKFYWIYWLVLSFFVESSEFSIYSIKSCVKFYLFFFFRLPWLLWLGLPILWWIKYYGDKSGKSRHPCLVPDLRETTFGFHHWVDVSCTLVTYDLYFVEGWSTFCFSLIFVYHSLLTFCGLKWTFYIILFFSFLSTLSSLGGCPRVCNVYLH